jgi:hypothetical protein
MIQVRLLRHQFKATITRQSVFWALFVLLPLFRIQTVSPLPSSVNLKVSRIVFNGLLCLFFLINTRHLAIKILPKSLWRYGLAVGLCFVGCAAAAWLFLNGFDGALDRKDKIIIFGRSALLFTLVWAVGTGSVLKKQLNAKAAASLPVLENVPPALPGKQAYWSVKSSYSDRRIAFQDVVMVEAFGDYVRIFVKGQPKPILSRMTLKSALAQLPTDDFLQVHRSFVVQLGHISRQKAGVLSLADGLEAPIGARFRESIKVGLQTEA